MSRTLVACVALMMAVGAPAGAASWSLGTHLGLGVIKPEFHNGGSSTVLAWPVNVFTYQPALRIAVGDDRHAHEVQFDSGLFFIDEAGSSLSLFTAQLAYQHTIAAQRSTAPFVQFALGLYREGGAASSSTAASYGLGVGVRRTVADRHGDVRAELRIDRVNHDDRFGRPAINNVTLRLGFDLWI